MRKLLQKITIFISMVVLSINAIAQENNTMFLRVNEYKNAGKKLEKTELFRWESNIPESKKEVLEKGAILNLNYSKLKQFANAETAGIEIKIPISADEFITLELIPNAMLDEGFRVITSESNGQPVPYTKGRYFQGIIKGEEASWAALSFFEDEVIGVMYSNRLGDLTLGEMSGSVGRKYVIYRNSDFRAMMPFECGNEGNPDLVQEEYTPGPENADPNKCVKVYFECEYDMYVSRNSSVTSTVNFMTGIYGVVKSLYDNENVNTAISEIFVWTTPDSYSTSSTSNALSSFKSFRPTFNGDLAHLVSRGQPTGGGVAYINGLCNSFGYAYSYIYGTYAQFPTYSWTTNVIAHEMGHNLGSRHTHDCVWDVSNNGVANEVVDICGQTAGYAGFNCNGTPSGSLPTNGGTVMSYCHLVSGVGINYNNGFGLLPGNRIRNYTYNATCLTACNSCPISVSIAKSDVLCNGQSNGSITATASGATGPYIFNWSNGATTSSISGLSAGTYALTVTSENGSGCSVNETVIITQPAVLNVTATVSPEAVQGAGNGSISTSVSGGTAPYSYLWSNGSTTATISNLTAGVYTVTVTDFNQCVKTATATVTSDGCPSVISQYPVQEGFETNFGIWNQITTDNFNWSRNSGSTSTNRTGPSSAFQGSWYAFINAAANNGTATLESPCLNIANTINPEFSFAYHMWGNGIGTLWVQVSTNNGASWTTIFTRSGDQGNSWLSAAVSLNNYKSSYTKIRISASTTGNSRGDIAIDNVIINAQPDPATSLNLSVSSYDATCFGGSDGQAMATASNGTAPYSYVWSNGAQGATASMLTAGTYTVTVTDQNGASASAIATVGEAPLITIQKQVVNETLAGNDGSVSITVSQGVAPFSYAWNNGATTQNISGLVAGLYSVTVTDANGCTASASAEVQGAVFCTSNAVTNATYFESFENGLGLWSQATDDNFDWTWNSGGTPTGNTGPSSAAHGQYYFYIECNGPSSGQSAALISPCLDLTNLVNPNLKFAYHMFGNQMGSMQVQLSTDQGATWTTVWTKSGNQGSSWLVENISLAAMAGGAVKIKVIGTIISGVRGDMAIDAFEILDLASTPVAMHGNHSITIADISPNPASSFINVEVTSPYETDAPIYIIDAIGKKYNMGNTRFMPGTNSLTLQLQNHAAGVYVLVIDDGVMIHSKRFIIIP